MHNQEQATLNFTADDYILLVQLQSLFLLKLENKCYLSQELDILSVYLWYQRPREFGETSHSFKIIQTSCNIT